MIGQHDRLVELHQPTTVQDAAGAPVTTWAKVGTAWAMIRAQSGREFLEAGGVQAELLYEIRIRHRNDVRPTWRLVYQGQTFEIQAVIDVDDQRRELALTAKELVAA